MRLIDAVAAETDKSNQAALRAYGALLSSPETGNDEGKAVKRLKGLIEQLGKTPEQVRSDVRLIGQVAKLREKIEAGRGIGEAVKRAARALEEYDAETKRVIQERKAGYAALYEAHGRLATAQFEAANAKVTVERMIAAEPALLGDGAGA